MNDKELLELAAKAAGIELTWFNGLPKDTTGFHPAQNIFSATSGNPLTDDGDALRLAVKLDLHILRFTNKTTVKASTWIDSFDERDDVDPYAATRRAIVRAAAAIGEQMK